MGSEAITVEILRHFFQGGEEYGNAIIPDDITNVLLDALQTLLYTKVRTTVSPRKADRVYNNNASFWAEALADKQFPSEYIVLDDFALTEWIPFSPGRYYTYSAEHHRQYAAGRVSLERNEYLPEGKASMVRGGIGTIRLAEKKVHGHMLYFLGASSTGIAHQGIPIALPSHEYRKVISIIKERGGCRARIVGSLQTLTEDMPFFSYDQIVPRYCFFAEEVSQVAAMRENPLTTVAVMFTTNRNKGWDSGHETGIDKSWTFCSFRPGSSGQDVITASEWLMDYAARHSDGEPYILTDFDEQRSLFSCPIEFPLPDILRGKVDWDTLQVYRNHYQGTYIENYYEQSFKECALVAGDQIIIQGSHNTVVTHSKVENAFNKIKRENDEDTAKALLQIEDAINRSRNPEAAENFDAFNDELSKPEPKKSLLRTLWSGTLEALPVIKELPGVVDSITKLFS